MSAHTPGPWQIRRYKDDIADSSGRRLTKFSYAKDCCSMKVDEDEREANARLIAAAPELAAILPRVVPLLIRLGDFIGNGDIDPSRVDSLGARCDLIGDIHVLLTRIEGA